MKKFFKSLSYAVSGFKKALKSERNFKIHTIIGIFVLILGLSLKVGVLEWSFLFMAAAGVLTMELMNTAVEKLADEISTEIKPQLADIKDISAAAVLVASVASAGVGLFILGPPLIKVLLRNF